MDVNIALLPDPQTAARIVTLSRRLADEFGSTLVLDGEQGPFPHLTLYLTAFVDRTLDTVPKLVQAATDGLPAPELPLERCIVSAQGAVLLNVKKTPELDHLHRFMIHKLNPFRMGAVPQIWEARRERYGAAELDRLDRIGFPQSLDAWSPHFTIGRVAREAKSSVPSSFCRPFRGMAGTVGVGAVGEHGTFTKCFSTVSFSET